MVERALLAHEVAELLRLQVRALESLVKLVDLFLVLALRLLHFPSQGGELLITAFQLGLEQRNLVLLLDKRIFLDVLSPNLLSESCVFLNQRVDVDIRRAAAHFENLIADLLPSHMPTRRRNHVLRKRLLR
jgi:hypothetical protein